LLESRSFDAYKNAIVSTIAILGCLEVDTEVSSTGMKLWNLMIIERCQEIMKMPMSVDYDVRESKIFLKRWMEVY